MIPRTCHLKKGVVTVKENRRFFMFHPMFSPITAIVAGVIVLVYPKILNYVVGIYLILIGVLQIVGKH